MRGLCDELTPAFHDGRSRVSMVGPWIRGTLPGAGPAGSLPVPKEKDFFSGARFGEFQGFPDPPVPQEETFAFGTRETEQIPSPLFDPLLHIQ